MKKRKDILMYSAIGLLAAIMTFYLVFSVVQCMRNFVEIELKTALLFAACIALLAAILTIIYFCNRIHRIKETRFGFWLSNNYPKLLLGYFILVFALMSITNEAVWTAEEINDVLTIEWTIFGLSLTVFLVWNVLIVEYLKKRKPVDLVNPDFVQKLQLMMDKRSYNQEVESTFTHMVYLTINLFMLLFSSSLVYFSHLPNEVLTQNIVRCTFFLSTNTIVMLFLDILKPLKDDKKSLIEDNQVSKSELDTAQVKAIIQMFIDAEIKRINETEGLSDEEKRRLTKEFFESCKAAIPSKKDSNSDGYTEINIDEG